MPSQFDSSLLPGSTTSYDVGSSSQRWRTIYGQTADFSGATTFSNSNGTFYVDDVTYTLATAVTAAMAAGGGHIYVGPGTHTLSSALVVGNSTTKPPVDIELDANATINVTVTGGVDAIKLHDGCGIRGCKGIGTANATYRGSLIKVATTANISSLITNGDKTGGQQGWYLTGLNLQGDASATITAMMDFTGGSAGTVMRDLTVNNFPSIGIRLLAVGSVITSDIYFDNVVVGGAVASSTARPWVFSAPAGTTGSVSRIYCIRCQAENAGTNKKLFELSGNGLGPSSVRDIYLYALALESGGQSGVTGLDMTDANNIYADGVSASDGGTDLVKISQTSAGFTYGIALKNINAFNWTNVINDTIGTVTVPTVSNVGFVSSYEVSAGGYGPTRIYHLGSQKDASYERLEIGYVSGFSPNPAILQQSSGAGVARSFKIGTQDAGQLDFITNSNARWSITSGGILEAASDNLLDLGQAASNRPRSIYAGTSVVSPKLATPRTNVTVANGANANVAISGASFVKLVGPTGVFSISGFTAGNDGDILQVYNSVAFAWTITNNATSTAANRILTLTGSDVTLRAGQSAATFRYDSVQSLWILMSTN